MISTFKDLIVWKEGHTLVLSIYKLTARFPREERFSLSDQLRRASVSVTSNIAEGFGRFSQKEKVDFYFYAYASLIEIQNQLTISRDIGYLENKIYYQLYERTIDIQKLLQALISRTKTLKY